MKFGTLLRKLRDKRRLSSRDIAGEIEISHSTYLDWEHDKCTPSLKHYMRLAHVLEVNPVALLAYLTGQTTEIAEAGEATSLSELKEMVRFYQEHIALLQAELNRLKVDPNAGSGHSLL